MASLFDELFDALELGNERADVQKRTLEGPERTSSDYWRLRMDFASVCAVDRNVWHQQTANGSRALLCSL